MISICIPTYESFDSFIRTLESTLMQRNCDYEVVIVDDSNSDNVWNIVKRKLIKHKNIRYTKNEPCLGAVKNWNLALSMAVGNVKKIMHHDDWFESETSLIQIADPILNNKADVVFSACKAFGKSGFKFNHEISDDTFDLIQRDPRRLIFGNVIGGPSVFAAASHIDIKFDPSYLWMADVELYIRLLSDKKVRCAKIDRPLVCISTELETQISRFFEKNKTACNRELLSLIDQEYNNKIMHLNDKKYIINALRGTPKYYCAFFVLKYVLKKNRPLASVIASSLFI